jgi:hypothetical protein
VASLLLEYQLEGKVRTQLDISVRDRWHKHVDPELGNSLQVALVADGADTEGPELDALDYLLNLQ